jgi:hypothetical protein
VRRTRGAFGILIATNQQDVAIMQADSAEALFLAKPPDQGQGPATNRQRS